MKIIAISFFSSSVCAFAFESWLFFKKKRYHIGTYCATAPFSFVATNKNGIWHLIKSYVYNGINNGDKGNILYLCKNLLKNETHREEETREQSCSQSVEEKYAWKTSTSTSTPTPNDSLQ